MIWFLTIFLLLCLPAQAISVFVSKTGADAHACSTTDSAATNKLTIASAVGCLAAGNTLTVHTGTYAEPLLTSSSTVPSGTAGLPTIIKAATGETVTITGSSGGANTYVNGKSYITLDGFIWDGNSEAVNLGVFIANSSHHITVQNGEIKNFKSSDTGAFTENGSGNHDLLLKNMHVHHNGTTNAGTTNHCVYIISTDTIVEDSEINNCRGMGIQNYSASGGVNNNTFRRNYIHHNYSYGMLLSSGTNLLSYNNIFDTNGTGTAGTGGLWVNCGSTKVCSSYNDASYNHNNGAAAGIRVVVGQAGAVKNLIALGNATNAVIPVGHTQSNNLTTGTATNYWTSPSTGDFTLKTGVNAIDTGADLSAIFTTDKAGLTRANGTTTGTAWDKGPHEYQSPPDTISVTFPNGGESLEVGSAQIYTFTHVGSDTTFDVSEDQDGNGSYETLLANDTSSLAVSLTVTGSANANRKIQVCASDGSPCDTSDAVYAATSSTPKTITVTFPISTTVIAQGQVAPIQITTAGLSGPLSAVLSRNNGAVYETATPLVVSQEFDQWDATWTFSGYSCVQCKVKVFLIADPTVYGESAAFRGSGSYLTMRGP